MASVAYHVSECWVLGIDSGVDEADFHLLICPQLSGNSLGSLTEVKDCHLPRSLLVPETRPGLFSLGKRIRYIVPSIAWISLLGSISYKESFYRKETSYKREMMLSQMEYKENHIPNSF